MKTLVIIRSITQLHPLPPPCASSLLTTLKMRLPIPHVLELTLRGVSDYFCSEAGFDSRDHIEALLFFPAHTLPDWL